MKKKDYLAFNVILEPFVPPVILERSDRIHSNLLPQ